MGRKHFSVVVFFLLACCRPAFLEASTDAPSEAIRQILERQQAPGAVHAVRLHDPLRVQQLYAQHRHQLLWHANGPLAGQYPALVRALQDSAAHGLNPAHYHGDILTAEAPGPSVGPERAAWLDVLATDALLRQIRHRSIGVVSPRQLDPDWELIAPEVDVLQWVAQWRQGGPDLHAALQALWPSAPEYYALVRARADILAEGDVHAPTVAPGRLIRPGDVGERVAQLRRRLLGPLDDADLYDPTLAQAVKSFQLASGLEADGIVGDATLDALNTTKVQWVDRLDANLERWRWLPRTLEPNRIRVNIAAYTLRAIREEQVSLQMRVIAGRPARRSPVFTEKLRYLVLNPYWNVPTTIAVQDKLPLLRQGPQPMMAQGYEVSTSAAGPYGALNQVDWSQVTRSNFRYQLRQRPGPQNALGQIKFMLPNRHAVYLHDTPNRELFAKEERAFSSGCIRLAEPMKLAEWLLRTDGQEQTWMQMGSLLDQREPRTVHLRRPVATYIVYFTAFTSEAGQVVYRRDIYQRDAALITALRG